MSQIEKAKEFAALHVKGRPIVLYNAWDAGSAKAIVDAGAKALATSSWAVAAAQGFKDGEDLSFAVAEQIIARITATVGKPVTMDFEGGYSDERWARMSREISGSSGSISKTAWSREKASMVSTGR